MHKYKTWQLCLALLLLLLNHFSCVQLCATPETAAHQAPPSLGFSRQEQWSGFPFPSPMHESKKWKWSRSVVSDSSQPHGLQPTRLLHLWDFPGKSTRVGCHCLLQCLALLLCNSFRYSSLLLILKLKISIIQPNYKIIKMIFLLFSSNMGQIQDSSYRSKVPEDQIINQEGWLHSNIQFALIWGKAHNFPLIFFFHIENNAFSY